MTAARVGLATLGALLLTAAAWELFGSGAVEASDWAEVSRGELVLAVDVSGTLESEESAVLGPPGVPSIWDYKISSLADEGSRVAAGDIVLAFDTTELQRYLRDKTAEHEQAVEELAKRRITHEIQRSKDDMERAEAEAKLRRAELKVDVPGELVGALELRQARSELQLARVELRHLDARTAARRRAEEAAIAILTQRRDRARERVEETQDSIRRMEVKTPLAGTVIHVTGRGGEKKKVGDQCWRGEKVVEIPNLERLRGRGEVDEVDAGKIRPGQPARIRLESHPDIEFEGRVERVHATVQPRSSSDPTKVVRIDVALDETDTTRMRPGMRFRGRIERAREQDLLLVPARSIFTSRHGPIAWRRTWRGAERVRVETGRRDGSRVEVLSGLEEDDRVSTRDLSGRGGES